MKKSKNDAKLQGDNHRLLHGLLLCPTSTFKSRNNSPDITKKLCSWREMNFANNRDMVAYMFTYVFGHSLTGVLDLNKIISSFC